MLVTLGTRFLCRLLRTKNMPPTLHLVNELSRSFKKEPVGAYRLK